MTALTITALVLGVAVGWIAIGIACVWLHNWLLGSHFERIYADDHSSNAVAAVFLWPILFIGDAVSTLANAVLWALPKKPRN